MEYLVLGFFTGISLILAIGAQNIFVIEQGLKKQHVFIVCLIFLTNYYVLNEAIYKVIFIGLASLTFPHILLEYLIEKNEK